MRRPLEERLKRIEQRLVASPPQPMRTVFPEWLITKLRSQGIEFPADRRPDLRQPTVSV
jgi:hypothetical protein